MGRTWGSPPKHAYPYEPSLAAGMVSATLAARATFVAIIDLRKGTAQ
jgi:hypothetical protein